MAPIKAMPRTLLDDEESQHKDGLRNVVRFVKRIGNIFGARRKEAVFDKVPVNVGSFANFLKDEF